MRSYYCQRSYSSTYCCHTARYCTNWHRRVYVQYIDQLGPVPRTLLLRAVPHFFENHHPYAVEVKRGTM